MDRAAPPRLWDISQTLRPGLPVWPGDTAFSAGRLWSMASGSPVNVGRLESTVHAGSHADAPLHYSLGGPSAADLPLHPYIGPCRVIDARACGSCITAGFVAAVVRDPPERLLFRTFAAFPHEQWTATFTAVEAAAITWLAEMGVRLIGIDSPSVDPQDSQSMDAHLALLAADMRVLEGLVLDDVSPGDYELIALPLKLAGLDASPVRAILREIAP